jgi:hypothetical protein
MSLAIGGDGKSPMGLVNPPMPFLSDVKFCNTRLWQYHDYGKDLIFLNTSGATAAFSLRGNG